MLVYIIISLWPCTGLRSVLWKLDYRLDESDVFNECQNADWKLEGRR